MFKTVLWGCAAFVVTNTPLYAADADHSAMDHSTMDHGTMDHSKMDHGAMDHGAMNHDAPTMTGALGPYNFTREASGTSWQPDSSTHSGLHATAGDWILMGHATLNGVYDWQGGPRGDARTFVSGMVMGTARRGFDNGDTLTFRAMLSPDPVMGRRGYPLLLASGETANGTAPLIDRQHPHDLFMELSASYSHALSEKSSVFLYAGLPGEPAFGPPAFMHRASIMDSPEAPISHHWLDSTHIIFGVATAGFVYENVKIEASQFTGREPNAARYDVDHPRFDSTSARVSWNPTAQLSLQASWGHFHSPEQLHPNENEDRWSASAIYTRALGEHASWSTTAAWGRKELSDGLNLNAWVLESAIKPTDLWTVFARGEMVDSHDLDISPGGHDAVHTVGKASFGAVRDFKIAAHMKFGVGGLYAFNWVPSGLKTAYGGSPQGAIAFVRLKIE